MATPIKCKCGVCNSIMHARCRDCGTVLPSGVDVAHADYLDDIHWETTNVGDLWRASQKINAPPIQIGFHRLANYCLFLEQLRQRAESRDKAVWFDDVLFFLRGGYDFACYLNLTSRLCRRVRIFGGLNHARRPSEKLQAWFHRLVAACERNGNDRADILVCDEVESGGGIGRFVNIIRNAAASCKRRRPSIQLHFHILPCCRNESDFDSESRSLAMNKNGRMDDTENGINVINEILPPLRGPLLYYDADDFSGLERLAAADNGSAQYRVRRPCGGLRILCEGTGHVLQSQGGPDAPSLLGHAPHELLGQPRQPFANAPSYIRLGEIIKSAGCDECRELHSALRA